MFRSPFLTWLKRQSQVAKGRPARLGRHSLRGKPYLEVLEDRTLLSASVMDVTTTMTPNSTAGAGQTVTVNVDFSQAVNVTGTPKLALSDSAATSAGFVSGSGTASLQFSFVVPSGDLATPIDYLNTGALTLNSGTIVDADDNTTPANLILQLPGTNGFDLLGADNIDIDGVAPTITNVATTTAGGTLGTGQTVVIDLNLSKAVTVNTTNGTPTLTLNATNGANPLTATYNAGLSTSTQLVFTYTTQAGDTTSGNALDYAAGGLNLHGATILDEANNALDPTTLSGATDDLVTAGIVIDATTPAVTSVTSSTSTGTYGTGATVVFDVNFSEAVTVNTTNGTPTLTLSDGKTASYTSGSGSSTLVFSYTVAGGDTTNGQALDLNGANALALNSGTIKNAGGVAATLGINSDQVAGKDIVIDATTTTVTSVTATAGTYGPGSTVVIGVNFSEAVVVNTTNGSPTLTLSDGKTATYYGGSGGSTLVFVYTVAGGDTTSGYPLDEASTTALNGTITNKGGVAATLNLPAPGTAGSLSKSGVVIGVATPTPTPTVTPSLRRRSSSSSRTLFRCSNTKSLEMSRPSCRRCNNLSRFS